jgi:SagB-type dehydrogenase family enzyme
MRPRLLALAVLAVLAAPAAPGADSQAVSLPAPRKEGRVSVEAALSARRSIRAYARQGLTLEEVGQLLWAAQGITGTEGKRAAPSARHRYPLEVAVVAQNVEGLPAGAYRYLPATHSLERLAEASGGRTMLAEAASQPAVQAAPAVFVIAAVYERMGTGARDRTWTDYEAGLASENLLLQAVALGLGGVVTGGIDPAAVKAAVRLRGNEQVIVVIPIGHPAR